MLTEIELHILSTLTLHMCIDDDEEEEEKVEDEEEKGEVWEKKGEEEDSHP